MTASTPPNPNSAHSAHRSPPSTPISPPTKASRPSGKRSNPSASPLDAAAINAGVGVGGLFAETDLDQEINIVRLNVEGTVHIAKHVVQHMVAQGSGRILITSSIASEMVAPREAVYAASKAFDLSFAKSLRAELEDTGVTVTALQPGPTDTDFFHRAGMDNTKVGTEGKKESEPYDVAKQGFEALMKGEEARLLRKLDHQAPGRRIRHRPRRRHRRHAREDRQTPQQELAKSWPVTAPPEHPRSPAAEHRRGALSLHPFARASRHTCSSTIEHTRRCPSAKKSRRCSASPCL